MQRARSVGNADRQRRSRHRYDRTASGAPYFLWDGGHPIEEFSRPADPTKPVAGKRYLWGMGQLLEQGATKFEGAVDETAGEFELASSWAQGDASRYAMVDQIGSVRLLTTPKGAPAQFTTWGPWGEKLEGGTGSRFGYTGHQREAATGLHYSVHRYLDPRNGRWTQRDPGGSIDGQNRYAYVRNGPLLATDQNGLHSFQGTITANFSPSVSGTFYKTMMGHFQFHVKATPGTPAADEEYGFIQVARALEDGVPVSPTGGSGFVIGPEEWARIKTSDGFAVDTGAYPESPYYHSSGEGSLRVGEHHLDDPAGMYDWPRPRMPDTYRFDAATIVVQRCPGAKGYVRAIAGYKWGFRYTFPSQIETTTSEKFYAIPPKFMDALRTYVSPGGGAVPAIQEDFISNW